MSFKTKENEREQTMLENERKEKIIALLTENGTMTTILLSQALFASEATVRRDLTDLESSGRVRRIHGGAELVVEPWMQLPLAKRDRENDLAKRNIAAKAAKLIHDGDTLFLDASSTVLRLIPLLRQFSGLTVVTNGPKAVIELAGTHIRTISTGGVLFGESVAFAGEQAERVVRSVNADIMFFACRGVTDDGWLCDSSLEETSIRREMLAHSKFKCFMCASRKLGDRYPFNICHMSEVDVMVTENSDIAVSR